MKVAIISRQGLGDGLLMMICSHHFKKIGAEVTFFHRLFHELKNFFPTCEFKELSKNENWKNFEIVIIEHCDNPLIEDLIKKREKNFFVVYPTFNPKKSSSLLHSDFVCDPSISMARNLLFFMEKFTDKKDLEKTNGIIIPKNLTYKKYKKRVLIFPLSASKNKDWRKNRFLKIYFKLEKKGYEPWICLGFEHREGWEKKGLRIFSASNYSEMACFIYESSLLIGNDSGPVHLASSLKIPSIVLGSNPRIMKLWKPDFFYCHEIFASRFIPNFFCCRLRNKYWAFSIPANRVWRKIKKVLKENKDTELSKQA